MKSSSVEVIDSCSSIDSLKVQFRRATPDDAPQISALITTLTQEFITPEFSVSAKNIMLNSMSKQTIWEHLQGDFEYFLAFDSVETKSATTTQTAPSDPHLIVKAPVLGVIGMRAQTHLFHLFVAKPVHRTGIAQRLWCYVLQHTEATHFSVNASRYAIPFYQKMGFDWNGNASEQADIICYPMTYVRPT